MVWHFPHGVAQQSTIRVNGWKLIKNWMPGRPEYELYQLHGDSAKSSKDSGRKELIRRMEAMEKESISRKRTTWLKKCLKRSNR